MKRCLDTNAYSRMREGKERLQVCLEEADLLVLPAIVLGDLYAGFELGTRTVENEVRLEAFLELPSVRIQEVNQDIARRYGVLVRQMRQAGIALPTNGCWVSSPPRRQRPSHTHDGGRAER
jgi:predicted nucleic acid-binding protein